jgi:hypothetical protein
MPGTDVADTKITIMVGVHATALATTHRLRRSRSRTRAWAGDNPA